jgi:hypothetical protein
LSVDAAAFRTALDSWHDFYLAVGSASAALLGLLFVGVSINLSTISASERADVRTRANVAFSNLLYLLSISLIALIPGSDARSIAVSFAAVAGVGLVRVSRRAIGLLRGKRRLSKSLATVRRLSWTFVADLVLLYISVSLSASRDANWLYDLTFVVFVLLIGAADTSWDLLVRESEEAQGLGAPSISTPSHADAEPAESASRK